MANVNLKTDFKDGEFLYADQLKNNFEAIQAALSAMNAIVWQDNADKVVTFRGTTEELMNREIIDGQILYDTTTGESYIDYKGKRISTGSGNAIHIGDTEPTNPSTQIWINKDDLSAVGSEVVNSLEGNEERMAPSVAAVNEGLYNLGLYFETITDLNLKAGDTYQLNLPKGSLWIEPLVSCWGNTTAGGTLVLIGGGSVYIVNNDKPIEDTTFRGIWVTCSYNGLVEISGYRHCGLDITGFRIWKFGLK